MSDLIYRRDAVSRMSDLLMIELGGKRLPTWNEVNDAINDLPSAEPEIIRCKECKHYVIYTLFGHRQGWCERLCDEYDKSLARGTEEDDFCSRAERRTDG